MSMTRTSKPSFARLVSLYWILMVSALYLLLTPLAVVVSAAQTAAPAAAQTSSQQESNTVETSSGSTYSSGKGGEKSTDSEARYSILLDAGSSSTKTKIYRWFPPKAHQVLPRLRLIKSGRLKPALATYRNDREGLATYLRDILFKPRERVPEAKHSSTPVFLMATAGLRFMRGPDVQSLLQMTRSLLTNTSINPFTFSGATVLSGEEEGVYSWIAANYLLGFFDADKHINETVGVLEMGGGSTQITFIPNGPLYAEEFHVTVAGKKYNLYVQSYLQFGISGMKVKVAQQLSELQPESTTVDNPCMLRGDISNIQLDNSLQLTMQGTGDPEECEEVLNTVLRPSTGSNCQPKPCAIGPVYQPELPNITFYATQAFTYAPRSLKTVGPDNILDINKLRDAAIHHCNRTLAEAVRDSGVDVQYASDDCLTSLYMPILLTTSYGFQRDTRTIKLTSKIGKQSIDWPLGAMLMELLSKASEDKSLNSVTCKTQSPPTVTVGYAKHKNSASSSYCPNSIMLAMSSALVIVYFIIGNWFHSRVTLKARRI